MKFGRSIPSRTLPFFGGSLLRTSKPAPPITPVFNASARACSSTRPPRAVLMRMASRRIIASSLEPIMLRVCCEGNMKGDDVAFLKNGEKIHEPWLRNDIGRQHLHSESFRALSDRLAKLPETDNPERRASDIADRMRKVAELVSALPRTIAHVLAISDQVSSQRENNAKTCSGTVLKA